ncbi:MULTISPECIES: hypothetical protein [Streptomyces]|uniref:LigA protein n=1 Tax=Streptomyces solicathayae TaxID=3081768 RepID=A0ABZ0M2T2_9ACTN|nr:hypothetical protein [Streptomyces sp. HUAS YS2]WOX25746.1 hypothetical protein R2D22_31955 [Streptomyces sp. HUAS YS2]
MIDRIWLQPPLAIARLGSSPVPCDNYRYGPSDLTPRGTGKTTVEPVESLDLAADGTLTTRMPQKVRFKDADGWRPVCPFFEVHGSWTTADGEQRTGVLTADVLAGFGLGLGDVRWQVSVANLKAHHITQQQDDRVEARAEVRGDDHQRHPLAGHSPQGAAQPLVPAGKSLPLGSVQVPAPNAELPELRLRFTPGKGFVYGPTDLIGRPGDYTLPDERLFLNANAPWSTFLVSQLNNDRRTFPPGLFAGAERTLQASQGLVDDTCDGTVTVTLPGGLTATARIVASPPDFAPDRRPFVSLADGLADRVKRAEVREAAYVAEQQQTSLEVRDLFERILETMGNMNVDVQNQRVLDDGNGDFAWPVPERLTGVLLALTDHGRRRHRRYAAQEVLEDVLREQPDLIERRIRPPAEDIDPSYTDGRMPIGMRGADAGPLHLTRRQYDLLTAWAQSLRENTEPGT